MKANPFYCNPAMAEDIKAGSREMNPDRRRDMLQQILTTLHQRVPAIWLVGCRDLLGLALRVGDVRGSSMGLYV